MASPGEEDVDTAMPARPVAPTVPPVPPTAPGAILDPEITPAASGGLEGARQVFPAFARREQQMLDRLAPHLWERWVAFAFVLLLFIARMLTIHGFYIITYILSIFLLNQFILFLQPKDRARLIADGPSLPSLDSDDYRPFYRMLPEFKFWYSSVRATILSLFCTFFPIFDIPVYWPVLVVYFVSLFFATMRRQFQDMKRFKYVPWDIGKKPGPNPKVVESSSRVGNSQPGATSK